jgi:ATP-dependent RNA helicase DHR2
MDGSAGVVGGGGQRGGGWWRLGGDPAFAASRRGLPIFPFASEIARSVKRSPVTVLVGETGSGKTTQTPQYLWQAGLLNGRAWDGGDATAAAAGSADGQWGADWGGAMVITQPRRVAAITVAHRVATEMGCPIGGGDGGGREAADGGGGGGAVGRKRRRPDGGDEPAATADRAPPGLVGYSVRFDDTCGPNTRIKFATDGMLLRCVRAGRPGGRVTTVGIGRGS